MSLLQHRPSENAEEFARRIKAQEGIKLGIINIQEEQASV
jgi:hypothetical protein